MFKFVIRLRERKKEEKEGRKRNREREKKERGVSHKKGVVSQGQHWNLGQASRQTNKKKKQEETREKGGRRVSRAFDRQRRGPNNPPHPRKERKKEKKERKKPLGFLHYPFGTAERIMKKRKEREKKKA